MTRMSTAIRFLGEDHKNHFAKGRFGISWAQDVGYTPQDRFEHQPVNCQNRWDVLFIGRLNHRKELARKLGINIGNLDQETDSEIASKAWARWQQKSIEHLYGRFTLLICDYKEQKLYGYRSIEGGSACLLYTSPSPRDQRGSRMPSSA